MNPTTYQLLQWTAIYVIGFATGILMAIFVAMLLKVQSLREAENGQDQ